MLVAMTAAEARLRLDGPQPVLALGAGAVFSLTAWTERMLFAGMAVGLRLLDHSPVLSKLSKLPRRTQKAPRRFAPPGTLPTAGALVAMRMRGPNTMNIDALKEAEQLVNALRVELRLHGLFDR